MRKRILLIALLLVSSFVAFSLAVMHKSFTLPNKARVKGIGVGIFWDQNCSRAASEIDWGVIEPGETKSVTLYFKSNSNVNITLTLTTDNWNPSNCTQYMNVYWNYTNAPLTPKSVTPIELYLQVYSNVTGIDPFTFDIIVYGSG